MVHTGRFRDAFKLRMVGGRNWLDSIYDSLHGSYPSGLLPDSLG